MGGANAVVYWCRHKTEIDKCYYEQLKELNKHHKQLKEQLRTQCSIMGNQCITIITKLGVSLMKYLDCLFRHCHLCKPSVYMAMVRLKVSVCTSLNN